MKEQLAIAVCDDDEDICDLIKIIGEQKDHTVFPCITPDDFENVSATNKLDVIFMDINWGSADGVAMAKKLKSDHKVFALSGADNIREIAQKEALDGYLEKPFSLNTIRSLLDEIVQSL